MFNLKELNPNKEPDLEWIKIILDFYQNLANKCDD